MRSDYHLFAANPLRLTVLAHAGAWCRHRNSALVVISGMLVPVILGGGWFLVRSIGERTQVVRFASTYARELEQLIHARVSLGTAPDALYLGVLITMVTVATIGIGVLASLLRHALLADVQVHDTAGSANRAKSGFVANTSHEVCKPMNGIIGMTPIEELNHESGGEGLVEFVEMFKAESPRMLGALRQAVADSNAKALCRAAHELKAACGNFGARRLRAICQALENQGRDGDLAGSAVVLDELLAEHQRVVTALENAGMASARS